MVRKNIVVEEKTRQRIRNVIDALDGRILGLNGQIPAKPPIKGTPAAETVAIVMAKREIVMELRELLLNEFHDDLIPQ
ncbi:MAG TPA: hypothetical protein PLN36_01480 [Bacteroidales bacterium]|nr:hypothetical protein [Bacteroidales bacterium]HRU33951.1 hypothetical protein [Bacteroidales bacterium]